MSTAIRVVYSLLAVLLLGGCAPVGLLYSNTVVPYSTKFNATQAGDKRCVINDYQVKDPVTGFSIYSEWTTRYILDEARKAGIREILYMDVKTLSFLNGLYKRESLIIYGD